MANCLPSLFGRAALLGEPRFPPPPTTDACVCLTAGDIPRDTAIIAYFASLI